MSVQFQSQNFQHILRASAVQVLVVGFPMQAGTFWLQECATPTSMAGRR